MKKMNEFIFSQDPEYILESANKKYKESYTKAIKLMKLNAGDMYMVYSTDNKSFTEFMEKKYDIRYFKNHYVIKKLRTTNMPEISERRVLKTCAAVTYSELFPTYYINFGDLKPVEMFINELNELGIFCVPQYSSALRRFEEFTIEINYEDVINEEC